MGLIMTKTILNAQKSDILKRHIIDVLNQATIDYQNTKQERKEIGSNYPHNEEEFTLLEEIELLTVELRGYASQIESKGKIDQEIEAREKLNSSSVFLIPVIAKFYFETKGYEQLKAYVKLLDYLRLLMIEYLQLDCRLG